MAKWVVTDKTVLRFETPVTPKEEVVEEYKPVYVTPRGLVTALWNYEKCIVNCNHVDIYIRKQANYVETTAFGDAVRSYSPCVEFGTRTIDLQRYVINGQLTDPIGWDDETEQFFFWD